MHNKDGNKDDTTTIFNQPIFQQFTVIKARSTKNKVLGIVGAGQDGCIQATAAMY